MDTPRSPGAKRPAAEQEQRAQGDLRDRRRKTKSQERLPKFKRPPSSSRPGVNFTICRLVHDMFAGSGVCGQQLHESRLYTCVCRGAADPG